MAIKEVDARGLSCPEPVVLTMKSVDKNCKEIKVIVDTNIAKENVSRFLKGKKFEITVEENSGDYYISGRR